MVSVPVWNNVIPENCQLSKMALTAMLSHFWAQVRRLIYKVVDYYQASAHRAAASSCSFSIADDSRHQKRLMVFMFLFASW